MLRWYIIWQTTLHLLVSAQWVPHIPNIYRTRDPLVPGIHWEAEAEATSQTCVRSVRRQVAWTNEGGVW